MSFVSFRPKWWFYLSDGEEHAHLQTRARALVFRHVFFLTSIVVLFLGGTNSQVTFLDGLGARSCHPLLLNMRSGRPSLVLDIFESGIGTLELHSAGLCCTLVFPRARARLLSGWHVCLPLCVLFRAHSPCILGVFAFLCNVVHMCRDSFALSCSCVLRGASSCLSFEKKCANMRFANTQGRFCALSRSCAHLLTQ